MAELDEHQTIDTGTAEATAPTPLSDILDTPAADVPAQDQEAEADIGSLDSPHVPLKALKRERERRQKADRQVEELRLELERFDNAKWGFDDPPAEQQQQQEQPADVDPAVHHYNQSLTNFTGKHGKEVVAKVDAGLKRMSAEQQRHVMDFMRNYAPNHPDPVGAIHAYVDQLGLLDFKATPIGDVLASKDKQPQPDNSQFDHRVAELNRHGQEVAATARRTEYLASKTDFVAEHGKDAFNQLDEISSAFMHSGDPRTQQYAHAIATSPDPVGTAVQLLSELGWWQQQQQQSPRQRAPQPQMTFPSNLANRRSVGQRQGPSYAGPTPLNDIFRH